MEKNKEKERAIIEFTCIPEVDLKKAEKLYEIGFRNLKEFLQFALDKNAKKKGLVEILNYNILSQYIQLGDENIPSTRFKCPMCGAMVYADQDECSECGALLLEEILEVEIQEVYSGLRNIIATVLSSSDAAKNYITKLREGEVEENIEEMEIITKEIKLQSINSGGFSAAVIAPEGKSGNRLTVIIPSSDYVEEIRLINTDLDALGAVHRMDYPIEGGNISNKQEEAVREVVADLFSQDDANEKRGKNTLILNMKVASFMESGATMIVEDNRPFLSNFDDITPQDPAIESAKTMLYDVKLVKDVRKIAKKVIVDGVSFNNDPLSFLLARECLSEIRKNPEHPILILDVVLNKGSVGAHYHSDLVRMLKKWK